MKGTKQSLQLQDKILQKSL